MIIILEFTFLVRLCSSTFFSLAPQKYKKKIYSKTKNMFISTKIFYKSN